MLTNNERNLCHACAPRNSVTLNYGTENVKNSGTQISVTWFSHLQ